MLKSELVSTLQSPPAFLLRTSRAAPLCCELRCWSLPCPGSFLVGYDQGHRTWDKLIIRCHGCRQCPTHIEHKCDSGVQRRREGVGSCGWMEGDREQRKREGREKKREESERGLGERGETLRMTRSLELSEFLFLTQPRASCQLAPPPTYSEHVSDK